MMIRSWGGMIQITQVTYMYILTNIKTKQKQNTLNGNTTQCDDSKKQTGVLVMGGCWGSASRATRETVLLWKNNY